MLTRRVALPLAALTAFATLPVLAAAAPAGASGSAIAPSPASRGGGENGDPEGPSKKNKEPVDNCPTKQWTVPLELKGLACILLLPKPEPGEGGEEGGGGVGGLL